MYIYMVFSPRRISSIKLLLNDDEIEKGHACKYLGIYLDDQLNWKHHIDYICEKLVKFTGIFYRLRSKISCEWLRNIYYSFVYPHLLYGIEMQMYAKNSLKNCARRFVLLMQ